MITPKELRKKMNRKYLAFLQASLTDIEDFFPITIPVGSIPKKDYHALRSGTLALQADAEKWGYGLPLVTKNLRALGGKTYPTAIIIPNKDVMLSMLSKKTEYRAFKNDIALIRQHLPQLDSWLSENIKSIIAYHGIWEDLIKVCEYFIANPQPNCYIRELPIAIHTKFVETYKPILTSLFDSLLPPDTIRMNVKRFERRYSLRHNEPLVRMRLLDDNLQQEYHFPVSDISLRLSDISKLPIQAKTCLIVENKMTFLTLPQFPNTIAIWGEGKKSAILGDIRWLASLEIVYWGDLDVDGFIILSKLRNKFPHVRSVMMNQTTYELFEQFSVPNTASATPKLSNLTAVETQMYYWLMTNQKRLEQEHIAHRYVLQVLHELM